MALANSSLGSNKVYNDDWKNNPIYEGMFESPKAQENISAQVTVSPSHTNVTSSQTNIAPEETVTTGNSGIDAYAAYLQVLQNQQAQFLAMLNAQAKMARKSVNNAYDDSAKKQYVSNEQAKVNLNQQSKLLGVGGLTESANLELETGYQQGLNELYKKKIEALAQIDMDLMNQKIDSANVYYDNLFDSAMRDSDFLQALVLTQNNAQAVAENGNNNSTKSVSLMNNNYEKNKSNDEYKSHVKNLRDSGYSESNIVYGLKDMGVNSEDMHKILL